MAQSYKTNQRLPFPVFSHLSWFLLLFFSVFHAAQGQQTAPKDSRGAEFFPYLAYRFTVPESQADAVWEYLRQSFGPEKESAGETEIEEEQLTDLYFDTPQQELLRRNLALRQRFFISADGRKEHLQLLLPPPPDSAMGKEVRFRHNKKPDKGAAFTTHPVLKLLRAKDRPVLDSLLKMYRLRPEALGIVLEVNQDRRRMHVRRQGNAWLTITLTQLIVQAPEHQNLELQIQADPAALKNGSKAQQQQLIKATKALAQQFQAQFPELKRVHKQEYALMESLHKKPAQQKINPKVAVGVTLLVVIIVIVVVRQFRRKPVSPIE